MTTITAVNFYQFLMSMSQREFGGKLSYAIYKNLTKLEPTIKAYFADVEALAKAFNIEMVDNKYTFEGEAQSEFELILNKIVEVDLHKVELSFIISERISVEQISMLDIMITE